MDETRNPSGDVRTAPKAGWVEPGPVSRTEQWFRENRAAIEEWNEYVAANGIPLAEYRQF